ncbi:hypothetical protein PAECIP111893_03650 [Paenibacillus plantiphilus]|uniref:Uncharacterized protein n=1 Tax=Paenibacillus plantiphilus TaxID=2905650 RepID=A0ABM9CGJ0_9BACL|nr:hypothetical protein PAECIP111893_03650 [Paenibacillus plantiphilus]
MMVEPRLSPRSLVVQALHRFSPGDGITTVIGWRVKEIVACPLPATAMIFICAAGTAAAVAAASFDAPLKPPELPAFTMI